MNRASGKQSSTQVFRHPFTRLVLLFSMLGCSQLILADKSATVYSIGVVPQFEARNIFDIWWPIITELEKRTGLKFELVGSPSIPAFETQLEQGHFDFAYMNPYHMLRQLQAGRYHPMIRDSQQHVQGILVVRKDSPIKHVDELIANKVAFPAPNALGASLLMRTELAREHLVNVRPHYVGTHSSVYLNVITGLVTAGGGVMNTLKQQERSVQDSLRILYTTRASASHPVTAHKRIPENIRNKVRDALLNMVNHSDTKILLSRVPIQQPVVATNADYQIMSDWGLEDYYEKSTE